MLQTNEIIALCLGAGILTLLALYEGVMNKIAAKKIRELRESANAWRSLYRTMMEERDLLLRRVESKDCQKVLSMQMKLDDAQEEIEQLKKLNETYKKQLEKNNGKKKATLGTANTEGC